MGISGGKSTQKKPMTEERDRSSTWFS